MPVTPSQLSLDQKVALLAGADTWHTVGFTEPPVPAIRMSDGPAGVRGTSWTGPPSALFPCGAALGATWDPPLVAEIGAALAREAHLKHAHVLLAPTINLQRTPVSGRNFEFYSEDPLLTAEIAVAYVSGLQAGGVAACVKHFVGNETEHERMTISSEIDERTLREVYLAPFEAVVRRGGARAVMSAYNRLNGVYCADHRWLLTDVLRDDWGFDGVVVSDWFGCHSTAPALLAGLDLEMPGPPRHRGDRLRAAVDAGEVSEDDLDRSVARLLALGEWTGAVAAATAADTATVAAEGTADDPVTRAVIRRAAARATVLLRNERDVLPLPGAPGRVALIGPYAEHGRAQGGGSARVTPNRGRGPLAALQARGVDVAFEPGGSIARYLPTVRGEFTLELTDDVGSTATVAAEGLSWYWDRAPAPGVDATTFAARATGEFVPPTGGPWEIGARAIGPVTVRLDDDVVVSITEPQTGGAFFGIGSPEVRATVELEGGRAYRLEVDHPGLEGALVRGLAVGARPVPAGDHIARAAAAAAGADVAVVIVGTDDDWEAEGADRESLALPGDQDELVAAIAAVNANTVVVLNTGSPVTMPWLGTVPAVMQLWFPGQEIGDALADVLFGDAEPGGRLPLTFPARLEDTPTAAHHPGVGGRAVYAERLHVGHRWYDREGVAPLFPFGHGLGYTTFTITPAAPAAVADAPAGGATVSVDVANTGSRPGGDVVQVYVAPPPGDPARPLRQLAGFRRVDLAPGATSRVDVDVDGRAFACWRDGGWHVPPGRYEVLVGRSSRELVSAGAVER